MDKLKTLKVKADALLEALTCGLQNEVFCYQAHWSEIQTKACQVATRQSLELPRDVQAARYALDLLGILAHQAKAEQDRSGRWLIRWS